MAPDPSPFFDAGTHASANNLGILQLRRDHLIPAILCPTAASDYAEGKVENTRFGSFPHSTLVGQPWGMQILASAVDTGSRGKKSLSPPSSSSTTKNKKRKRDARDEDQDSPNEVIMDNGRQLVKAAAASSGFAHLIPPTPEIWTLSLPHRTQVVYTPDYSYILQRLRARPGDHIIEAGAGSGSFTHAAARAVYNGFSSPDEQDTKDNNNNTLDTDTNTDPAAVVAKKGRGKKRQGAVYSFEYHEPRASKLRAEIKAHGLDPTVIITHRDVYEDGFCLQDSTAPDADMVFLDLPAPWRALPHLTRSFSSPAVSASIGGERSTVSPSGERPVIPPEQSPPPPPPPFRSPLNPQNVVRICTFSPCIEQVIETVSAMRALGWLEIDMVELQARRLEVRRERVGLSEEGIRGGNPSAATVQEAVQRLRDVEGRAAVFHSLQKEKQQNIMRKAEAKKRGEPVPTVKDEGDASAKRAKKANLEALPPSKQDRLEQARREVGKRQLWKEGRLVHRTEQEIKTHTSYLVFALLPREWTEEDEQKARRKWGQDQT